MSASVTKYQPQFYTTCEINMIALSPRQEWSLPL